MRESKFYKRIFKLERYEFKKEQDRTYNVLKENNRIKVELKLDYELNELKIKATLINSKLPEVYLKREQERINAICRLLPTKIKKTTQFDLKSLCNQLKKVNHMIIKMENKLKFLPSKEQLKTKCEEVQNYLDKYIEIIEINAKDNILNMLKTEEDWGQAEQYILIKNAYQELLKFKDVYKPSTFPDLCYNLDPIRAVEFYAGRTFYFNSPYLIELTKNDLLSKPMLEIKGEDECLN